MYRHLCLAIEMEACFCLRNKQYLRVSRSRYAICLFNNREKDYGL